MKRKSIFLLGTILAGAALVGGTFAAWAVTDNASPFSVQITPGTLDVGENKAVTLEWGTKGLVNIENLEMGKEKGPYVLGLKATTSDESDFTGNLAVYLTTTAETSGALLLDNLDVKVYAGEAKAVKPNTDPVEYVDPILTILNSQAHDTTTVTEYQAGTTASKTSKKDIDVNSGTEYKVSFYVSFKEGITPALYESIKSQIVNLTVDWNKGSQVEEITSQTIYFKKIDGWTGDTMYAHAYNFSSGKTSGEWPGAAMTRVKGDIWSIAIENEYDRVIFNDGVESNNKGGHQYPGANENGLVIPAATANTPYYLYENNAGSWVAKPDISADADYYFVSDLTTWEPSATYKLTKLNPAVEKDGHNYTYALKDANGLKSITATTTGGAKIVSSDNLWYNETSYESGASDVDLVNGGIYNIYFNPNPEQGGQYLYLDCTNITFDTYSLDLVGILGANNNWTTDNATIFVHAWDDTANTTVPTRNYRLSSYTTLKIPHDATKFLLVRAAAGTKTIIWKGTIGFFNQSVDLARSSDSTKTLLKVTAWSDGTEDAKSTFDWVVPQA